MQRRRKKRAHEWDAESLAGWLDEHPKIWFEELRGEAFVDLLLDQPKHWLFLSNVWELPARLNDAVLEEWVPGYGLDEDDTILTYSRPFRVRIRSG